MLYEVITLSRYLHKAELAEWQNIVLGPVVGHYIAHVIIYFLAIGSNMHVNEINNNDSTHVSQP